MNILPDVIYVKEQFKELIDQKCNVIAGNVFAYEKAPDFIKSQNKKCDICNEALDNEMIYCAFISSDPEKILNIYT